MKEFARNFDSELAKKIVESGRRALPMNSYGPFQLVIEGEAQFPWSLTLLNIQHEIAELKGMKENQPESWYVINHGTGEHLFVHPSPFRREE